MASERSYRDQARLAAYDVLRAVDDEDAYANLVLARLLRERGIIGRDAALATELVGGTLRGQGTYDAVLGFLVSRQLDPPVRDALRLGAHQLLAMRVPSHAAVSTTVDLVRHRVGHRPAGFVNAVLRKVAAHDLGEWIRRVAPDPAVEKVGHLAVAHSHPRWVIDAFAEALNRPEELESLLAADNRPPLVVLAARPGVSSVEELVATGGSTPTATLRAVSETAVELAGGDPGRVPAVAEGRAGVQDAGSQLVAHLLAGAPLDGRDRLWLDLCAGPGGKAALLAALAATRGARLLAVERQPHRAVLVNRSVRAVTGGMLGVVAADGTRSTWSDGSFDRVLVDAPCSGLGALRRRPEARWRRSPDDLSVLAPLQRRLLEAGLDATRPGGVLVYATCSPVLAETSLVVSAILADRADVRLEDTGRFAPPDAGGPLPGTLQLWPHRHGTDAMFVALLRRVS